MDCLLIATKDRGLIDSVKAGLNDKYLITPLTDADDFKPRDEACKLVVVDQGFSDFNGIDFLMNIVSTCRVPTLYLGAANDPATISEALNVGASGFLVKSENFESVLPLSITDTLRRFAEARELQDSIRKLKDELDNTIRSAPASRSGSGVSQGVFNEVVTILKTGEVNLPVYPSVMKEIRELLQKGASIQGLSSLLQKDSAITAKMISVANSAFYRGIKPTRTLHEAINRIGVVDTKNYVELISNRNLYNSNVPRYEAFLKQLWEHSLATAYCAQEICKRVLKGNQSELFTIGLFHDIGKLLLVKILTELEVRKICSPEQIDAEWRGIIENYHHKFGCSLIKRWKLPDEYAAHIMGLKNRDPGQGNAPELAIVTLANLVAKDLGFNTGDPVKVDFFSNPSAKQLDLQESDILEIEGAVRELMDTCSAL